MNFIIGIDPGKTGAVAIVSANGAEGEVWDMPETESDLLNLSDEIVGLYGYPHCIYLESVHAMPGQGVSSSFKFGMEFGKCRMFCATFQRRWVLVSPPKWKRAMNLAKDKEQARALAQQLYPMLNLCLKKHHGRAEALLLAEYGRRCEAQAR